MNIQHSCRAQKRHLNCWRVVMAPSEPADQIPAEQQIRWLPATGNEFPDHPQIIP